MAATFSKAAYAGGVGRVYVVGAILAVALLVYGIVDLIVTSDARIRRLNRVLWAVIIVLVPIIGPIAWLTLGKAPVGTDAPVAPDDLEPPSPTTSWLSDEESDRRIRDLEAQLQALDDEELPERPAPEPEPEPEAPSDRDDAEPHPHEAGRDDDGDPSRA